MIKEKDIGMRIAQIMNSRNMTQQQVADGVGVSREIVNHWIHGTRYIKAEHIIKLSKLFNVSTDYILGTSEDDNRETDYQSSSMRPMIKDSGERTEFETGAVRDMHIGKGRMDLLPWHAIIEVSKHCENGALKYGEHNVDKGIPMSSLLDSGLRHTAKFVIGMEDEPHLTAACWNLLWALEMKLTKPDMVDVPYKEDE